MDMRWQLSGFSELDAALRNMPRAVAQTAVRKGLVASGVVFTRALQQAAPIRAKGDKPKKLKMGGVRLRGFLRAQLRATKPFVDRKVGTMSIRLNAGKAFYGRFLEFGTKHQSKRPFFLHAIQGAATAGFEKLRSTIADAIAQYRR